MDFLTASMTSQCIVVLDAFDSMSKLSYESEIAVHWKVMEAAKKSMSLTSNNSIFGLIFEVVQIHPFWAHTDDNHLKRDLKITAILILKGRIEKFEY